MEPLQQKSKFNSGSTNDSGDNNSGSHGSSSGGSSAELAFFQVMKNKYLLQHIVSFQQQVASSGKKWLQWTDGNLAVIYPCWYLEAMRWHSLHQLWIMLLVMVTWK